MVFRVQRRILTNNLNDGPDHIEESPDHILSSGDLLDQLDDGSFQVRGLRPHLGQRVLSTMSNQAWHKHGASEDPIKTAKAWSAEMDRGKR